MDPYDYMPVDDPLGENAGDNPHPLVQSLDQKLTYDVNNYDQVVDQIYN